MVIAVRKVPSFENRTNKPQITCYNNSPHHRQWWLLRLYFDFKMKSTRKGQHRRAPWIKLLSCRFPPERKGATEREAKSSSDVNDTKKKWPGVNMASALDDDEILNDDYYSLLNVRREVKYAVAIAVDVCAGPRRSHSTNFLRLIFNGYLFKHMLR